MPLVDPKGAFRRTGGWRGRLFSTHAAGLLKEGGNLIGFDAAYLLLVIFPVEGPHRGVVNRCFSFAVLGIHVRAMVQQQPRGFQAAFLIRVVAFQSHFLLKSPQRSATHHHHELPEMAKPGCDGAPAADQGRRPRRFKE